MATDVKMRLGAVEAHREAAGQRRGAAAAATDSTAVDPDEIGDASSASWGESSRRRDGEGMDLTAAIDGLDSLRDMLEARHRLDVEIMDLVGLLDASGRVEQIEGLPLDLLLGLEARLTRSERWMLLEAYRVLSSMPVTRKLLREGQLSWSQVRRIVGRARRLRVEQRERLDDHIRSSLDLVDKMDPDQLIDAVERAADGLEKARTVERRERRRAEQNFLQVQGMLDGGLSLYGEYDAVTGAGVLGAIDAASGAPQANSEPAGAPTSRARQRAAGLADICAEWQGGGSSKDGGRRRARPLMLVHVDLSEVTPTAGGMVELNVPGGLETVTSRMTEILARDADMRAVIFDGARPLGVSDLVHAEDVPTKTRIAVRARDRGCRFPGSRAPAPQADVHHLRERSRGGTHDPDNLTLVSRTPHVRWIHRNGWAIQLDPQTGDVTIRRGDRAFRSVPWGTRLRPPDRNTPDGRCAMSKESLTTVPLPDEPPPSIAGFAPFGTDPPNP